jgi:hypothetical protein
MEVEKLRGKYTHNLLRQRRDIEMTTLYIVEHIVPGHAIKANVLAMLLHFAF